MIFGCVQPSCRASETKVVFWKSEHLLAIQKDGRWYATLLLLLSTSLNLGESSLNCGSRTHLQITLTRQFCCKTSRTCGQKLRMLITHPRATRTSTLSSSPKWLMESGGTRHFLLGSLIFLQCLTRGLSSYYLAMTDIHAP